MPRISAEFTDWGPQTATLKRLDQHVNAGIERSLLVLWGAVGLVLLIVCANLSGLLLARTASRSKEIAVRLAIGASRGRIVRQLVTESAVLSLLGAGLGVPLAYAAGHLRQVAARAERAAAAPCGGRRHGAAVHGRRGDCLWCRLRPAAGGTHRQRDPQHAMREQTRGSTQGLTQARLRSALVAGEVALACILLVGAGLLLRTFLRVQAVDLGFAPSQALAMRVNIGGDLDVQARRRAAPGNHPSHRAPSPASNRPPSPTRCRSNATARGPSAFPARSTSAASGRSRSSTSPVPDSSRPWACGCERAANWPTAIAPTVNRSSSSARAWPARCTPARTPSDAWPASAGAACASSASSRDIRQTSLETGGALHFFLPYTQIDNGRLDLVVRSSLPIASISPAIRRTLGALDPRLSATDLRPLEALVDRAISPRRFLVALLGGFAIIALALACIGIYSTVAFSVGERVREFGVRMALGATAGDISRGVFRQTAMLAAVGVTIGALASLWLGRLMTSLLFETSATDALTFVVTALVLATVAIVAGYVPAARAARLSPMVALRDE